jgi:hypothetical protein
MWFWTIELRQEEKGEILIKNSFLFFVVVVVLDNTIICLESKKNIIKNECSYSYFNQTFLYLY